MARPGTFTMKNVEIISQTGTKIGDVSVTFTVGRIGKSKCPRCDSFDVKVERERRPMHDTVTCGACNYVGPLRNPNQPHSR